MIILSQNLTNFDFPIPQNSIFRINLAWVNSIDELTSLLEKHSEQLIFLDLPVGRTKPPNNKYSINELISIINLNKNIKYLAISNVNNKNDLELYRNLLPTHTTIVPKIESPTGVKNIHEIVENLPNDKIIMLDHDDLFSNTLKENGTPEKFKDYMTELVNFCNSSNVILLRTIGVVFSDQEKRISDYSQ